MDGVFAPDVRMLLAAYPEWVTIGAGPGSYLSNGELPARRRQGTRRGCSPAAGSIDGNLERSEPVTEAGVGEAVAPQLVPPRATATTPLRRPFEGETSPSYTGGVPLTALDGGAQVQLGQGGPL